jgi:hypothetical protein
MLTTHLRLLRLNHVGQNDDGMTCFCVAFFHYLFPQIHKISAIWLLLTMTTMKCPISLTYGLLVAVALQRTTTAFQQPHSCFGSRYTACGTSEQRSLFDQRREYAFSSSLQEQGAPFTIHHKWTRGLWMSNTEEEVVDPTESLDSSTLWILGAIPALSLLVPALLQAKLILPLLIFKRVYIYLMAGTVVAISAMRGASEDSPQLGTRLVDLTRDILPDSSSLALLEDGVEDVRFQELEILDQVEGSTQAIGLPLIVVSSLVASLFFVLLQNTDFSSMAGGSDELASSGLEPLFESIQAILPQLVTLSNGFVVSLFCRAELQRSNITSATASLVAALVLSALAYLGPASLVWPIQNLLCMCLAINVSRAIQLPQLGPILLALGGLVAYDVVSVGVQLVNLGSLTMLASGAVGASPGDATSSAMGAVALSKAVGMTATSTWQPGLFQVQIRGAVSDLLGLGDAVFPSLLATFLRRYDLQSSQEDTKYFEASLVGFAGGCLACEFVPGIGSSGLPALLFIVPSMLTTVAGLALVRGNLQSLWSFDATADEAE